MNVNFAHTITLWAKYDAYEIKEAPDGQRYVMPCKDAMPEPYKPTIEPEQLVLDAINTGLYSMRQDEKGMEKAVFKKKGKESVWHVSDDNTMVALSAFLSSQPQSQIMSFHRIYAERYDWIRESFRQIAFKALTCHYYYNETEHLDDDLSYGIA